MNAYEAASVRKYTQIAAEEVPETIRAMEESNPALARLNAETLDQSRGFEISKVRILGLIDDTDTRTVAKTIRQWKACVLHKHGITVTYKHAIKGYRYPTTEEELYVGHDKRAAAVERMAKKEWLRLAVIRATDLQDSERRRRLALCDSMNDTAGKLNAQRQQASLWAKRPETLPRVNGEG